LKLEWSRLAQADLREAIEFIAGDNPRAADDIEDRIFEAADSLLAYPDKGRVGRRGTREWVAPRTPYILIYRRTGSGVEIVRVWHMSREPFA
jgi:toxin ParE1/3/4